MNEEQKAKIIIKTLNKIYPKAPVPLKSKNTFTLLISVLLSAQCTDCLLYTSPSPRDGLLSRMPSSA